MLYYKRPQNQQIVKQMNFGNIVIMMSKLAQSQETLRSGGINEFSKQRIDDEQTGTKSGDFAQRGQQNVIMHTCADCFHILDLVTFIKP